LLHASNTGTRRYFHEQCEAIRSIVDDDAVWEEFAKDWLGHVEVCGQSWWAPAPSMPRGCIIGRARVVGLIRPDGRPDTAASAEAIDRLGIDMRWHALGQWGHVLGDVAAVPHTPCKGALDLFDVETAVALQARQGLLFP
jgi:hypothetical protein